MEITYMMIGADGRQYGPITLEQLKTWVAEGRITRETNISRSDTNSWLPATQYTELGLAQTIAPAALSPAAPVNHSVLERRVRMGARWFFWIAALSLINTFMNMSNQKIVFVIGLGFTQMVDGFANRMDSGGATIGLVLNIIIAGVFALFGFFAWKRQSWSFIVGMVLYVLDASLFLISSLWLGLAFHAYVLFWMFLGLKANLQLKALEKGGAAPGH